MKLATKLGLAALLAAGILGGSGAGAVNVSRCPQVPGSEQRFSGAMIVVGSGPTETAQPAVRCTYKSGNGNKDAHSFRAETPNIWTITVMQVVGGKKVTKLVAQGKGVTAGGQSEMVKSGNFTAPKNSTVTITVRNGCAREGDQPPCGAIGLITVGAQNA